MESSRDQEPGALTTNRHRTIWAGVVIFGILTILYGLFIWKGKTALVDFRVFYTAGERFLAGEQLCQPSDGHYQFKYLPISALYFVPLSLLPLAGAKFLWLVVVTAAMIGIVYFSYRLLGSTEDKWPTLVLPTVFIMLKFYLREMELGQTNAVLTLILLGSLAALLAKKDLLSGLLMGLAISLKPYALIFLPYVALKGRFKALGAAISTTIITLLLPSLRYGFDGNVTLHQEWWNLVSHSTRGLLTNPDNVSLFGAFAKWFGDTSVVATGFSIAAAGALLLVACYVVTRPIDLRKDELAVRTAWLAESSLLLILIPLLSPQGWDYVFLTGTLGTMLLISVRKQMPKVCWWFLIAVFAVVGLSLYDLLGRELYRAFMDASILTACFVLIALYLMWLRLALCGRVRC